MSDIGRYSIVKPTFAMDSMSRVAIDVAVLVYIIILLSSHKPLPSFLSSLIIVLSKLALATQLIHITVIHS